MRKKHRVATMALRGFGEERIARLTRRGFDRHLFFLCERTNVRPAQFKINVGHLRWRACAPLDLLLTRQAERLSYNFLVGRGDKLLHKTRVGIARSAAQLVIQMTNDQFLVTETD